MIILEHKVAKAAREHLNLSQATVANDIGLSRPDLSKFENGKLVLSDGHQESLRQYYIEVGGVAELSEEELLGSEPKNKAFDYRIRDGIVIANHIGEDDVEVLMAEYQFNETEIQRLSELPLTKAVKTHEDNESAAPFVNALCRRQYAITQALQGKVDIGGDFSNGSAELSTVGQYMDFSGAGRLASTGENEPERLVFPLFHQDVPEKIEEERSFFGVLAATGTIVGGLAIVLLSGGK